MMQYALQYAEKGWPVFPLNGKHPRIEGWQNAASTEPEQIKTWWTTWPNANIGVITGERLGLWVLDIDPKSGGNVSFEVMVLTNGVLDSALEARTGSGGAHLYFPFSRNVRNSVGVDEGIDVRGEGGFIVVPPSVHPDTGRPYVWR